MALQNLSDNQNERLKRLEIQLKKAATKGDLRSAKIITADIQEILRPLGEETRLMQVKNWLYEAAIEFGDYAFAVSGLNGIKLKTNKNTRVHLEATALLAIAYIRQGDFKNAELQIQAVLKNDKVIKSATKRAEFRKAIIERFDEEVTLFSIIGSGKEELNIDEIQSIAKNHFENSTEKELYHAIGSAIPESVIRSLYRIDSFAKNQLPSAERIKLPSPEIQISQDEVGKTFFHSIKRTLYKSLCDPESDIYKTWFNEGLKIVLNKRYLTSAIVSTFLGFGIGIKAIAASVVALVLKFGIEVYCTHFKPDGVMGLR